MVFRLERSFGSFPAAALTERGVEAAAGYRAVPEGAGETEGNATETGLEVSKGHRPRLRSKNEASLHAYSSPRSVSVVRKVMCEHRIPVDAFCSKCD